jgi:hypothetical protein
MRAASRRTRFSPTGAILGGLAKGILSRVEDAIGSSDDAAEQAFNGRLRAQLSSVCPTVGDDIERIWYEVRRAANLRVVIHIEPLGAGADRITTEFTISWDDLPDGHRRALILDKRFARIVYTRSPNGAAT